MAIESRVSDVKHGVKLSFDQVGTTFKGIRDVGLWANGLFLHDDREVELVVLCSQHPTVKLLGQVAQSLSTHLKVLLYSSNLSSFVSI